MQTFLLAALPQALADFLNLLASGLWLALFLVAAVYRERLLRALNVAMHKHTSTPYILRANLKEMQRINVHVESLLYGMKADRACVFQFLDGQTFALANHSWKVNCTVERHTLAARSAAADNQNIPISLITDFLGPLLLPDTKVPGVQVVPVCATKPFCQDNFGGLRRALRYDIAEMPTSRVTALAGEQAIRVVLATALLHKSEHQPIGFLALQYEHDDGRADTAQEAMCLLCRAAGDIEELLVKGADKPKKGLWRSIFSPSGN